MALFVVFNTLIVGFGVYSLSFDEKKNVSLHNKFDRLMNMLEAIFICLATYCMFNGGVLIMVFSSAFKQRMDKSVTAWMRDIKEEYPA